MKERARTLLTNTANPFAGALYGVNTPGGGLAY